MTSKEIRQSFLDFFKEKEHSIVPSSSLLPESPGLLFTNAGMNQFVPFFLGTQKAPYEPPRAADTQKCIRAGGKHNDLEDVGFDTYHQTLFEMLGNWSFGDYFKKEAIEWAWELLVDRWGFPPSRLFATVYMPGDGDPAEFDEEAYKYWRLVFERAGLDPDVHIVHGNKKDNFWMMGDTGPCGPCSEIHVDLTPEGNTKGELVNADDARCIELWNLVFIQYNAEPDGTFKPLPACHVDTGMGFERACSMIQGTAGFTDFSKPISNYETDVFRPIFDALEEASGQTYGCTLPIKKEGLTDQEQTDIAFRVIADHLRTLSFAIADGIRPGNAGRNYVLRRILRRAVKFGRSLGLGKDGPFLGSLVPTLVSEFGAIFPEISTKEEAIIELLNSEELLFGQTIDRGMKLFESEQKRTEGNTFSGKTAFDLESTYGFPIDLTELMASECGLHVDMEDYSNCLEEHQKISKGNAQSEVIAALDFKSEVETEFTGFDENESSARIIEFIEREGEYFAIVDKCPLYAEKGGQVSDHGQLIIGDEDILILDVTQVGAAFCLRIDGMISSWEGDPIDVILKVDSERRRMIETHHTATHLMHWALHEIVGPEVAQQGSLVDNGRLRFDFNSEALRPDQVSEVERLVNEKISDNDPVFWVEVEHSDVRERKDIMQFFGDKYGDMVRVVQIGGSESDLNGYSMELCGGTHLRNTGDIGLFKIKSEGAISAGVRRIEAVCGIVAQDFVKERIAGLKEESNDLQQKLGSALQSLGDDDRAVPSMTGDDSEIETWVLFRDSLRDALINTDKTLKKRQSADAAAEADTVLADLIAGSQGEVPLILHAFEGTPALLQELLNGLKKKQFSGVGVLTVIDSDKVHLGVSVSSEFTDRFHAGNIISKLAPIIGGKGGGKPEMARGAGNDAASVDSMMEEARKLII
ncbi:MAG: alanine--tRNA ligase [Verrucomicrobiales bacterium]|nr:alanine--tRNA ligase [Verrucomicrobiales bacterium]